MKNIFEITAIAMLVALAASCKKESTIQSPLHAETVTIDMGNKEVKYGSGAAVFDFNHDGNRDFLCSVTLVGDPIAGIDKRRFMVTSGVQSLFAVNNNEETPCLSKGDSIPMENFNGYYWNLVLSVMLVERTENTAGDINWLGNWKNAVKKYLPFQMNINNERHAGWIELSIDIPQQKIILHKAAYTKLPGKEIKAGL